MSDIAIIKTILKRYKVLFVCVTDGEVEECVDPGGNGDILNMWGGQGTRPAKGGGKWTVGIGQWRRLDAFKMLEGSRDGLVATQNQPYAQSTTYQLCNVCVKSVILQITVIVNHILL
jgi:hypothetical protein